MYAWACSARDAGVDALRMEALAPSAKRSRTGEAAGEAAGQPEGFAAKYASVKPLILFAICIYMPTPLRGPSADINGRG